jgi:hypothetical protein
VHAQLEQLAGDPRVTPARVLARQAQHERTDATLNRWPSGSSLWLRPSAAHQLPVPAQQRLRRHDQALAAASGKDSAQCGEEGAIGRPKTRPRLLPTEHRKLVAQNE